MTLTSLIPLVVEVSIVLIVIGIGLRTTPADATYFFRRPAELGRALLSMNVVMPVCAVLLVETFDLLPAVRIVLVALSLSPVPPLLPLKASKVSAGGDYAISLLVAAAVVAVAFVPAVLDVIGHLFGIEVGAAPKTIAMLMLKTVLGPLALGMAVHAVAPNLARKLAKPTTQVAAVLLLVGLLPILFTAFPTLKSLMGNGTLLALAAFVVLGIVTGHLLGGPDPEHRSVLALTTSSRHPGVALAIAQANYPAEKAVLAVVLLYLIVNAVVALPYMRRSKRALTLEARPIDPAHRPMSHARR